MVIDMHVHPVLFGPICTDSKRLEFRKQAFGLYKSSPIPMEQVIAVMDHAGVDKAVILAEDYSAVMGSIKRRDSSDYGCGTGKIYRICKCGSEKR